ncbi:hypothetical protein [Amantichitinum ursilacus]|uniref:Hemolysin XhlA n=1 Tax=Amantichitinum ursilacus TaxID=857265 RepID=A0A0N0GKL8_9NEIS|nr:hypothetical protein [Amantichitinum ursilacus]KPC49125.1 hypothetical protein WG78_21435 [Amantichitinum ursilacus]
MNRYHNEKLRRATTRRPPYHSDPDRQYGREVVELRLGQLENSVIDIRADISSMTHDISALRQDVSVLRTEVSFIRTDYASKADLLAATHKILMWVISSVILAQLLPAAIQRLAG